MSLILGGGSLKSCMKLLLLIGVLPVTVITLLWSVIQYKWNLDYSDTYFHIFR